jgi:hypothetical protein
MFLRETMLDAATESLPLYLDLCELARVIGWSRHRTKTLLSGAGILNRRGGRLVCTRHDLRDAFPEAYDELKARLERVRSGKTC